MAVTPSKHTPRAPAGAAALPAGVVPPPAPASFRGRTVRLRHRLGRHLAVLPWGPWAALALLAVAPVAFGALPANPLQWPLGIALASGVLLAAAVGIPVAVHVQYARENRHTELRLRRSPGGLLCLLIRYRGHQFTYFDPYLRSARLVRTPRRGGLLSGYAFAELQFVDGMTLYATTLMAPLATLQQLASSTERDLLPSLPLPESSSSQRQTHFQRAVATYKRKFRRKQDYKLYRVLRERAKHLPEARTAAVAVLLERGYRLEEIDEIEGGNA